MSPFYPSQLADGGYDVDDYRDVDPRIGTLDEFDEMVIKLHAKNIRVIVDIVRTTPLTSMSRSKQSQQVRAPPSAIATSSVTDSAKMANFPRRTGDTFSGLGWTQVAPGERHPRPVVLPLLHS